MPSVRVVARLSRKSLVGEAREAHCEAFGNRDGRISSGFTCAAVRCISPRALQPRLPVGPLSVCADPTAVCVEPPCENVPAASLPAPVSAPDKTERRECAAGSVGTFDAAP